MSDFSEVTNVSWFSRIKSAVGGFVFGLVLVTAAFVLLFWNEGRAVKTARALKEGAGAVVSSSADRVNPADEGRLVHVTGVATTADTLTDAVFGVSANAVRLRRKVEMYQWNESSQTRTEKRLGGGEVKRTDYTYDKRWSDRPINSASFHQAGHGNPGALPYDSQDWAAGKVALGAFTLSSSLERQMDDFQPLPVTSADAQRLPAELSSKLKPAGGSYVQGADPGNPQVGDVRISFSTVAPETVSVVSKQVGSTFEPCGTKAGRDIDILELGAHSADEMFKTAMEHNRTLAWVLRAAGFFAMFLGLVLLFRPLAVLADVLPFLGSIVGAGAALVSFMVAAAFSLATIAVAWIAYRPLIGGALLVAGIGLFVVGVTRRSAARTATK